MFYYTIGNNKKNAIIFLHGWGCDCSIWELVASFLPKSDCYYVFLDFAGFGKSEEPQIPYTVYNYADEVVELMDELGLERASFVGHSFGGRIAIILGALYSERVNKLLLVDSAGVIVGRGIKYKLKVARYKIKKRMYERGLTKTQPTGGSDDYRALKSDVMRSTFVNVVNEDLKSLLCKIDAPTTIFWGNQDKDTPIKIAKILNKKIKNSKLFVLKDAGHYSFVDKMQDFVYILYENIIL